MRRSSSSTEAWYALLALICAIAGIGVGLRWKAGPAGGLNMLKINTIIFPIALMFLSSLVTWFITVNYSKKKQIRYQKELAKKTVRKTFELMKTSKRTLDNLDVKANRIMSASPGPTIDKALSYEVLQNIRNQIVEIYNGMRICIEDWREVLSEEFDEIEKKERMLDKLTFEHLFKSQKLKEYEQTGTGTEKEILTIKADLARIAERQRTSQIDIISESRKLVGAPITAITSVAQSAPAQIMLEQPQNQTLFLNGDENS
ncbi:MAG TPA: hypothetical protein VGK02_00120 [Candidatus Aquicultor sp.]|jgi:hypothetical protein